MNMAIASKETTIPLRRVEDLKAHIQVIVDVSRAMNMAATDAMLTAKQVDDYSRGYTVASNQFRRLNRQLDHSMDEMLEHISRLVEEISAMSEDERAMQYLEAAREMSHANQLLRGLAARRRDDGEQQSQVSVKENWIVLGQELHHAFLMLQTALGLARSASIDAIGKEMEAALKHAVGEIDATTQRVLLGIRQFSSNSEN